MFAIASDNLDFVRKALETVNPNEAVCPQSALAFTLTNKNLTNKLGIVGILLDHGADATRSDFIRDEVVYSPDLFSDVALNLQQMKCTQRGAPNIPSSSLDRIPLNPFFKFSLAFSLLLSLSACHKHVNANTSTSTLTISLFLVKNNLTQPSYPFWFWRSCYTRSNTSKLNIYYTQECAWLPMIVMQFLFVDGSMVYLYIFSSFYSPPLPIVIYSYCLPPITISHCGLLSVLLITPYWEWISLYLSTYYFVTHITFTLTIGLSIATAITPDWAFFFHLTVANATPESYILVNFRNQSLGSTFGISHSGQLLY